MNGYRTYPLYSMGMSHGLICMHDDSLILLPPFHSKGTMIPDESNIPMHQNSVFEGPKTIWLAHKFHLLYILAAHGCFLEVKYNTY